MIKRLGMRGLLPAAALAVATLADGNLQHVNHIIIVMQENHSFDNYFGALAYVPNTPYHSATGWGGIAPARAATAPAWTGLRASSRRACSSAATATAAIRAAPCGRSTSPGTAPGPTSSTAGSAAIRKGTSGGRTTWSTRARTTASCG